MSLKDVFPQSLLDRDGEAKKLIDALDVGLRTNDLRRIADLFDIVKMSDETAERWLKALGWRWRWPEQRRLLLRFLLNIYRLRGTKYGIEYVLSLFGYPEIEIREAWPEAYEKGIALDDQERIRCTAVVTDDILAYKQGVLAVCNFMKPAHALLEYVYFHEDEVYNKFRQQLQMALSGSVLATIFTYRELRLDGTWFLDGTYPLAYVVRLPDLPDLKVALSGEVTHEINVTAQSNLRGEIELPKSDALGMGLDYFVEPEKTEEFNTVWKAQHANSFYISCDWLKIDRPLWYLDGTYALDGEKMLDAGLTIEPI